MLWDTVILQKENDLLLPFHREKADVKNFLELLVISRNFSLILAASFVPIREKCVFRVGAILLVSVYKNPSTSIEVIVELDFFDVISLRVFHNSLGFPLFLLIKSE